MKHTRGFRNGILIVGDSLPPNIKTTSNIKSVLDPKHPVYNSLIVPIKYYLDNYLNSQGYQLPLEKVGEDYFFYINAVDNPKTKSNPNLTKLKKEIKRPEHKIILSMGSFAFWAVEYCLNEDCSLNKKLSIVRLGEIFDKRMNSLSVQPKLNLPILHNVANLKFEEAIKFIAEYKDRYISYFHYVGTQLGKLLLTNRDEFTPILRRGV